MSKIYTIGHSTHTSEAFLDLLKKHKIEAVVDIRSVPYSKFTPHFNGDKLKDSLKSEGVYYIPMYKELGARRDEFQVYENGQVQFDQVRDLPIYQEGIERILGGSERFRVAIMCACGKAEKCHRTPMIVQELEKYDVEIEHITPSGQIERHEDMMLRLSGKKKELEQNDLFGAEPDPVNKREVYEKLAIQVAYKKPEKGYNR